MTSHEWVRRKKELEARMARFEQALKEIANGDGCYGMQAMKYKDVARVALGQKTIGAQPND